MLKIEIKETSIGKQMMLDENDSCAVFYIQNGFSESKVKDIYERVIEDIIMDEIVDESEISRIYLHILTNNRITDLIPLEVIRMLNEFYNCLSNVCKEEIRKYRNNIFTKLIRYDECFKVLLISIDFEKILRNLSNKMNSSDVSNLYLTLSFLKVNRNKHENVDVLYTALSKAISKISL